MCEMVSAHFGNLNRRRPTIGAQIPSKAVSDGADLLAPTRALLEELSLLGTATDTAAADGVSSVLKGPPQSVALIEAGATAATKWWASGLSVSVLAAWAAVKIWYPNQGESVQVATLGSAAVVTAALVLAIGYLIASDVRGRAHAAAATIDARAKVALAMLTAAESLYVRPPAASAVELIALPGPHEVRNNTRAAAEEPGWTAVAMQRQADGSLAYVVVKGSNEEIVPASQLDF
jgi:hypothetical protein